MPYDLIASRTPAFVTNGGYTGVTIALHHGVPIVQAGDTEEKGEIGARIRWSGVGVRLGTTRPDDDAVGAAVRRVLDESGFPRRRPAWPPRWPSTTLRARAPTCSSGWPPRVRPCATTTRCRSRVEVRTRHGARPPGMAGQAGAVADRRSALGQAGLVTWVMRSWGPGATPPGVAVEEVLERVEVDLAAEPVGAPVSTVKPSPPSARKLFTVTR